MALDPPPLGDMIYRPSNIALSFAQSVSPVRPNQFAPPHATIALARAVVGAIVAHVLAVRLYL